MVYRKTYRPQEKAKSKFALDNIPEGAGQCKGICACDGKCRCWPSEKRPNVSCPFYGKSRQERIALSKRKTFRHIGD